jgi:hypothetical protein
VIGKRNFDEKKVIVRGWVRRLNNLKKELPMMKRTRGGCHINIHVNATSYVTSEREPRGCHMVMKSKKVKEDLETSESITFDPEFGFKYGYSHWKSLDENNPTKRFG